MKRRHFSNLQGRAMFRNQHPNTLPPWERPRQEPRGSCDIADISSRTSGGAHDPCGGGCGDHAGGRKPGSIGSRSHNIWRSRHFLWDMDASASDQVQEGRALGPMGCWLFVGLERGGRSAGLFVAHPARKLITHLAAFPADPQSSDGDARFRSRPNDLPGPFAVFGRG
jgi:hypothetical protein